MQDLLKLLSQKMVDSPYQFRFSSAAEEVAILDVEEDYDWRLPEDYRQFLLHFNGGFICEGHWEEYIWETGHDSLAKDHSLFLYSLEEVARNYQDFWDLQWTAAFPGYPEASTPIAIGETAGGSYLMINELPNGLGEHPIYDGSPTVFNNMRGVLFPNFKTFLTQYIAREGFLPDFREQAEFAQNRYCRQWMKENPLSPLAQIFKSDNYEENIPELSNILLKSPLDFAARCLRAFNYLRLKKWYAARDDCSFVLLYDPDNLWAIALRQVALYRSLYDEFAWEERQWLKSRELILSGKIDAD